MGAFPLTSLSVICVYNNRAILDAQLLFSLRKQTHPYELVLVDNVEGRFRSASAALNFGASEATGDFLLFVHQDVSLMSENCLQELMKTVPSLQSLGVAGAAGAMDSSQQGEVISAMTHGTPPRQVSQTSASVPTRVQTVDECFLAVPKAVFGQIRFDEEVCDDWHLYGVDFCLMAEGHGYHSYVVPLRIQHSSAGELSAGYYRTLEKLLDKYRPRYSSIHTTTGVWTMTFSPMAQERIGLVVRGLRKLSSRIGVTSEVVGSVLALLGRLCYTPPR